MRTVWLAGGRDRAADPRIAEPPGQERARPRRDTEIGQRRQVGVTDPPACQVTSTEGPHHQHAKSEFFGERQDPGLNLTLERVVRDLDGVEPAGPHDRLEFLEGRGVPVGGAEEGDLAGFTARLQLG